MTARKDIERQMDAQNPAIIIREVVEAALWDYVDPETFDFDAVAHAMWVEFINRYYAAPEVEDMADDGA